MSACRLGRLRGLLIFVAVVASSRWSFADSFSAPLQVRVTVVRSCSVATAPTATASPSLTLDCRKGAANVVRVGVADLGLTHVQRLSPGVNQLDLTRVQETPSPRGAGLTLSIDF